MSSGKSFGKGILQQKLSPSNDIFAAQHPPNRLRIRPVLFGQNPLRKCFNRIFIQHRHPRACSTITP